MGVKTIVQPAYTPELNPAEQVFQEVRRCVEGRVYGSIEEKVAAVDTCLSRLESDPERVKLLEGWEWINRNVGRLHENYAHHHTETVLAVSRILMLSSPEEPKSNTESVLMKGFETALRKRQCFRESSSRILIAELDGLQGRPDLVDARLQVLPFAVELGVLATSLRSPSKARVLAVLRYGASRRMDYLTRVTGLSNRSLRGNIRQLEGDGLVKVREDSAVSLGCPLPWSMVDIVAYEAKLSNWRRALHQAIGYRSFSHSVRVIMPAAGAQRAKKLATIFRSNGIGLIAIEDDGSIQIEIRSRRRRPSSRRLYLMAVGAVLKGFLEKRRYLYSDIDSETIQGI